MSDKFWTKLGVFFGHVLAMTMVICAWLIIVVVTLKVIWFTLFRIFTVRYDRWMILSSFPGP